MTSVRYVSAGSLISLLLQPIAEKAARTALHQTIRTLFEGELESSVADDPRAKASEPAGGADPNDVKFVPPVEASAKKDEDGQRIVIKYSRGNRGKNGGGWMSSDSRSSEPPTLLRRPPNFF